MTQAGNGFFGKILTRFFCLVFALASLSAFGSRQDPTQKWDGKIEIQNGVTIVENAGRPIYDGAICEFTEELSIGKGEGSEEQLFTSVYDIDVDADGNIYILDMRAAQVRVFDMKGRFLRSFGKKGQGPGEFQVPVYLEISPDGRLLCFDTIAFRLTYFSKTGEFLKQILYPNIRGFRPHHVDSQGNLIGHSVLAPAPISGEILKIANAEGDRVLDVFKIDSDFSRREKMEFDIGKPWICYAADRSDHVYWGYSEKYEIQMIDATGKVLKIIRNRTKPVAISAEDKIAAEKDYADVLKRGFKLAFRDAHPFFRSLSVDARNRLFVQTSEKGKGSPARYFYDIYDPEGRYLAKVLIPANIDGMSIWAGDKLYTLETDQEGYEKIVRYRVAWNLK